MPTSQSTPITWSASGTGCGPTCRPTRTTTPAPSTPRSPSGRCRCGRRPGTELTISSWNALQAARPQLAPADYDARLAAAADLVAERVISNRIATIELARDVYFREYLTGIGVTTQEQFRAQVPPELEASIRAGGTPEAAFRAGLQGAAVQGVIGTGTDVWRMATDPYAHPYWAPEIVARGGLQAAGGFASQAAETAIIAPSAEALLGQTGAAASLLRGGSRLAGGAGPAFVIAPAITMGSMALDELFTDAYYTRIDYAAAGTRSAFAGAGGAAIGTAGGALAAGAAGALMGSEVPLLGTAVGFVVGFAGYKLVDWWIGDDIEHDVRLALGEGGCPGRGRWSSPNSTPRVSVSRQASGSGWPTAAIARSSGCALATRCSPSTVTTRTLVPQVVEDTVAHPATVVLTLLLADGTLLRTTSGHPVFDGSGWALAGTLRPGDRVLRVDNPAGVRMDPLRTVGVVAVTTQAPNRSTTSPSAGRTRFSPRGSSCTTRPSEDAGTGVSDRPPISRAARAAGARQRPPSASAGDDVLGQREQEIAVGAGGGVRQDGVGLTLGGVRELGRRPDRRVDAAAPVELLPDPPHVLLRPVPAGGTQERPQPLPVLAAQDALQVDDHQRALPLVQVPEDLLAVLLGAS